MKARKKDILTIPNLISLLRLLMIPVYIILYVNADTACDYAVAAAVLALSCITDMADGWIARKFHMISDIGIVLDPIADKGTQGAVIICLAIDFPVLWALFGLLLVKESFQFFAGLACYRKGKMMKGALMSGKICTVALFVSLIALILFHETVTPLCVTIITVTDALFMLNAFIRYGVAYQKQIPLIRDIGK